jgi:hypothetical protein
MLPIKRVLLCSFCCFIEMVLVLVDGPVVHSRLCVVVVPGLGLHRLHVVRVRDRRHVARRGGHGPVTGRAPVAVHLRRLRRTLQANVARVIKITNSKFLNS